MWGRGASSRRRRYAYRDPGLDLAVYKRRGGASELLESVWVPGGVRRALLHVRDYTKGHPSLEANNHQIRHGAVVGIHNGVVKNDEEIFGRYGLERAEPGMTVDSEAIFALVDRFGSKAPRSLSWRGYWRQRGSTSDLPTPSSSPEGPGARSWFGESRREAFSSPRPVRRWR